MALTDSLEIYHRFTGGIDDVFDLSGNNLGLVEVGSYTTYGPDGSAGKKDVAAHFSGTALHYLKRDADDAVFDFGGSDFTISLWVKVDDRSGEQNLTEKFYGTTGPGWTLYKHSSHYLEFYYHGFQFAGATLLSNDTWYHVVVRRNGSAWVLKLDNSTDGSSTSSTSFTGTTEPLRLGHRNEADGRHFPLNGWIDEYAIWSRALTDDEIAEVYNSGVGKFLLGSNVGRKAHPFADSKVGRASWTADGTLGGAQSWAGA